MRFSEEDLVQIQNKVNDIASKPVNWIDQMTTLLQKNQSVHINELNRLITFAETSHELIPEMVDLRIFLNQANNWIESLNRTISKKRSPRKSHPNESAVDRLFGPERTLSSYYSFLREANEMSLDSPEVQILRDAISQAEDFQEKVKILLEDKNSSLNQVNYLYNVGLNIEIGMEELIKLERKKDVLQWEENTESCLSKSFEEIRPFMELIKTGMSLAISSDHPKMLALKQLKLRADKWRDDAHIMLRATSLKISDLPRIEEFISEGKSRPFYKATMQQVEHLKASLKDWDEKASQIFQRDEHRRFIIGHAKKPKYEEVKQIMLDSKNENIDLEIADISAVLYTTDSWLSKGKRTLGRGNSSKSFSLLLNDLDKNVFTFAKIPNTNISGCICRKGETDKQLTVTLS